MKAYFLSDLHLGAPYFPDSKEVERNVVAFLDSIKDKADVIYLVGDILDYWYEYRYVVPRGFVRFFGKLAELTDRGVRVVWYIGNHDIWIFDYLPSELGVEVIDGYNIENIDGHKFLISHGDGIGKLKPSFKILRKFFRNKYCQKAFSAIHPRWTVPFAYNWSRHSRKLEGPSAEDAARMMTNIREFSSEYVKEFPDVEYFIFGHLHLFLREKVKNSHSELVVLGEWITKNSYAVWDGKNLELCQYATLGTTKRGK